MDEKTLQNIKRQLQSKAAQDRVLRNIERVQFEATVTIGLTQYSESVSRYS
jgi:hypothetical protein